MPKRRRQIPFPTDVVSLDLLEAARQEGYDAGYQAALSAVAERGQRVVELARRRQYRTIDLAHVREIAEQL